MAFEEKKFLDLAGLQSYDAKIKAKIAAADKTLDDAIKAVSGDLKAEVQNRKDADTAINNKIGEVAEGKTVVEMIADAQTAATYDDTKVKEDIKANADAIDAINDAETGILKQSKDYADDLKDNLEGKIGEVAEGKTLAGLIAEEADRAKKAEAANKVTLTTAETATEGYLKTYVITQGEAEVGKIDIPKELVVTAGAVVVNPDGQPEGTYIKLTIANQEEPIFINVKDLIDVYTAEQNAAQVQVAISDTNVVSATIVASSIGTTELADAAVTTAKIADGNVTRAKISEAFEAQIAALESAVGEGGSVATQIDNKINLLDADVTSAEVEAGKGVRVQVKEADGKVTEVVVSGNFNEAYDAKGAAAAAQKAATDAAAADAKTKADQALSDAKTYANELNSSLVAVSNDEIAALFAE